MLWPRAVRVARHVLERDQLKNPSVRPGSPAVVRRGRQFFRRTGGSISRHEEVRSRLCIFSGAPTSQRACLAIWSIGCEADERIVLQRNTRIVPLEGAN